jgi:hypothetical protein
MIALALLVLLAADTAQSKHVCAGPFNATFGTAHVVLKSIVRGGFNAIGYEFGRFNSSALWLGSIEGQTLTRLGKNENGDAFVVWTYKKKKKKK